MKHYFYTIIIALLACANAMARQLTPSEALDRLHSASAGKGAIGKSASSYQLTYSSIRNGIATYYAFNDTTAGGFVVLSADDRMPAVLMMSDGAASFDMTSMPADMKWWLSQYDITTLDGTDQRAYDITALTSHEEIMPLLGNIEWGQDAPFNAFCPSYGDSMAVTGCVPTAMAQIMKYHRWPERGVGSKTYGYQFIYYADDIEYIDMTASSDFYRHTYRWDDMLDAYPTATSGTQSQRDAVAQLMYDCGVAASTYYGNIGTGSFAFDAMNGMVEHFSYDPTVACLPRSLFTDSEWEERMYQELANGRPIMYAGNDSLMGGHEFVCDGYRDGLFHINWGWKGDDNCYVSLTGMKSSTIPALAPELPDGTAYGSFSSDQTACVNIMPYRGPGRSEVEMICDNAYTPCIMDANQGTLVNATSFTRESDMLYVAGSIYNANYKTTVYDLGVKAEGANGTYYLEANIDTLIAYGGYTSYGVRLIDILKTGTYTITPIYKNISEGDTEWREMTLRSDNTRPKITVRGASPFIRITDTPLITSRGEVTPDNEVVKENGIVELGISLPVEILGNMTYSRNKHYLSALIYSAETGDYVAEENLYLYGTYTSGTTATLTFSNDDNASGVNDNLEVGKSYVILFAHTYTSAIAGGEKMVILPTLQYQNVLFTVVDGTKTAVASVSADKAQPSQSHRARKVLSNGRVTILKDGRRYSIDGK